MKIWKRPADQAGDTIVEVLIVIAVISSVLAGAFMVSQRSAAAVRDSQEHSEMLQVLQGQLELLRARAITEPNATTGVFASNPQYFCMDNRPTNPDGSANMNYGQQVPQPGLTDRTNHADYAAPCKGIQDRYHIAIRYNSNAADRTFTIYGHWDGVTGRPGSEQLTYRVYPSIQ